MHAVCPNCRAQIPLDDLNVATDLALCRPCGLTHRFSELGSTSRAGSVELDRPPAGAWFEQTSMGFEVGATTRSFVAIFLVPFMVMWSGGSVGSIYGTQLATGEFDVGRSLFGLPFLLGSVVLGSATLMALAGKVVVRVVGNDATVFTGVGPIGWNRTFPWRDVTMVRTTLTPGKRNSVHERLTLEGQRRVDFASTLSTERRHFMLAALEKMLRARP